MAGSISEFKSSFNTDLARPSRFDVNIPIPLGLNSLFSAPSRRLTFRCENTELPGRSLATAQMKIYGPEEKYPYQSIYNDINLTFIVGDDMFEKKFFDSWFDWINSTFSYDFRYKKDYVVQLSITQYNLNNKPSYSANLIDAYPIAINSLDLDWSSDGHHKLAVTFAYTYWENNSPQATNQQFADAGQPGVAINGAPTSGIGLGIQQQNNINGSALLTNSRLGTDFVIENQT